MVSLSHPLSLLSSFSLRLFLLRDSQSNPKAFVLTLCHHQKIKHFQILPVSHTTQHTITHREADHCTALTLRTFKDCFLIRLHHTPGIQLQLSSQKLNFQVFHSAILQSVRSPPLSQAAICLNLPCHSTEINLKCFKVSVYPNYNKHMLTFSSKGHR